MDNKIATRARVWSKLSQSVLKQGYDAGLTALVNKDESDYHIDEQEYESLMAFTDDYDELSMHQDLASKLAWRDFRETYSPADEAEMAKKTVDILESLSTRLKKNTGRSLKKTNMYVYES